MRRARSNPKVCGTEQGKGGQLNLQCTDDVTTSSEISSRICGNNPRKGILLSFREHCLKFPRICSIFFHGKPCFCIIVSQLLSSSCELVLGFQMQVVSGPLMRRVLTLISIDHQLNVMLSDNDKLQWKTNKQPSVLLKRRSKSAEPLVAKSHGNWFTWFIKTLQWYTSIDAR